MKKVAKRMVAVVCTAVILCSISTVETNALTRRRYGDVNNDGIISNADVELIEQYIAGLELFDSYQKIAADVDGNGKISMADVITIQRVLAGLEDGFPVGEYFIY